MRRIVCVFVCRTYVSREGRSTRPVAGGARDPYRGHRLTEPEARLRGLGAPAVPEGLRPRPDVLYRLRRRGITPLGSLAAAGSRRCTLRPCGPLNSALSALEDALYITRVQLVQVAPFGSFTDVANSNSIRKYRFRDVFQMESVYLLQALLWLRRLT